MCEPPDLTLKNLDFQIELATADFKKNRVLHITICLERNRNFANFSAFYVTASLRNVKELWADFSEFSGHK